MSKNIPLDKDRELVQKFQQLGVDVKDIQEDFIRAQGPGGQNVNKVATCVVVHHIPTGLKVKCQEERTQALNRYKARCLLIKKIEQQQESQKAARKAAKEKIRRQNRKRSKKAKERMLEQKSQQAQKKLNRKKVKTENWKDY